jgi:hypothetical protein
MEHARRAADVLRHAESTLRELVSKAATGGDYACVVKIAAWAQAVGDIVKQASSEDSPASVPRPVAAAAPRAPAKVNGSHRKSPSAATDAYPKFFRQGEQLLRIAWSKKEKKEYQHKATHSALAALADAMVKLGKDGRIFSTDDFLPINDSDGTEIPAYQAYVGIALLKQTALIDQHGRQGYSIPRPAEFKSDIEAVWMKLPEQ